MGKKLKLVFIQIKILNDIACNLNWIEFELVQSKFNWGQIQWNWIQKHWIELKHTEWNSNLLELDLNSIESRFDQIQCKFNLKRNGVQFDA